MNKVLHVDFNQKYLVKTEDIEEKEERLDPVLERVKQKMDPEGFKVFKAYVDKWMEECFLYEMEQRNKDDE